MPCSSAFYPRCSGIGRLTFTTLLAFFLCSPPGATNQQSVINVGLILPDGLLHHSTNNGTNPERLFDDINQKLVLEGALANYQLKLQTSSYADIECKTGGELGKGAWTASDFYHNLNVRAFLGPVCADDIELLSRLSLGWNVVQFNFYRDYHLDVDVRTIVQMSTMSAANLASNLAAVLSLGNWRKIALISCTSCIEGSSDQIDRDVSARLGTIRRVLEEMGIHVLVDIDVQEADSKDPAQLAHLLEEARHKARVFVALFGSTLSAYVNFLVAMKQAGMAPSEGDYVSIVAAATYTTDDLDRPWVVAKGQEASGIDSSYINSTICSLFDKTIVISNNYYNAAEMSQYATEHGLQSLDMSKLMVAVQLIESYWLYAVSLEKAYDATGSLDVYMNGTYIRKLMSDAVMKGPFGPIALNSNNQRLAPFEVLTVDIATSELYEIARISIHQGCANEKDSQCTSLEARSVVVEASASKVPLKYQFDSSLPADTPSCGFTGELCNQRSTIIVIASVMVFTCTVFAVFLVFRRVRTDETSQMPWAIPSSLVRFVELDQNRTSSMSIHSIQQQIESQTAIRDLLKSRRLATIEQGFMIVEPYRLNEKVVFDKKDMALLFQMKQAVHDNINPFVGVCIDRTNEFYVVWRHCFRGTLADLIFGTKPMGSKIGDEHHSPADNLDDNFKGAFVRDLIKGLDYLHTSMIGYHGALTASQCLVDSHWILKLSGFGVSRLLYRWKYNGTLSSGKAVGNAPLIPSSELHYYAPELRRAIKRSVQRNRPEELDFTNADGQAQDSYSFGVVLYEILYRKKVADLEDQVVETSRAQADTGDDSAGGFFSAEAEKKLPIYPTLPSDHEIHPDLVALMHRCFNGVPSKRPDASMIRKITDATLKIPGSLVDQMIKNMELYTNNLENLVREQTSKLEEEQQLTEQILLELLPKPVVDELRMGNRVEPQFYKSVTIMYSDIVGFTSLCSESSPIEVVTLLNGMFRAFDHAISQHKAYKVETIGDAYMVASGVPERMKNAHVREIACIALKQREFLRQYEVPHRAGMHLQCRWGFNSGPVFTGVVGNTAPRYCVFGTTVTLAAKMENSGQPGKIQMTLKSYQLLSTQFPEFICSPRGGARLEGIGTLLTYWLDGTESPISSLEDIKSIPADSEQ